MTKYIFITGGVVSSLGKGIAAASIANLLENSGLKINIVKFDPYINVDPGTMNPYQHGEVYVLDDGAETDLDLGYYERFTNASLDRTNSVSAGQVYQSVIAKERAGEYLGQTIQVIPHITNEIKSRIELSSRNGEMDIVLCEIGGTVGDIESLPFLEAIRQFRLSKKRSDTLFIHLTLIPEIRVSGEIKTKPTQHSTRELLKNGIQPDILLCRTHTQLTDEAKNKIALFCNISKDCVFSGIDADTSIYQIPIEFEKEQITEKIMELLSIDPPQKYSTALWDQIVSKIKNCNETINIAFVGKYLELKDAYRSINEALFHGGFDNLLKVKIIGLDPEKLRDSGAFEIFKENNIHGLLVPGGFGARGSEGKIAAIKCARENNVPFLGICLGMQCAVIEYARNVCSLENANSCEFEANTPHPVISLMEEQKNVVNKGATMRLGIWECKLLPDTLAHKTYSKPVIGERHRHRYEFNNQFRTTLEQNGLKVSGMSTRTDLVEIVEIPEHPFFIGVQFHPEFKSRPYAPHPLFSGFVKAAREYMENTRDK